MIRRLLITISLSVVAALSVTQSATAQVMEVPNTGCPSSAYPTTRGMPAIGTPFAARGPSCAFGEIPFLLLGVSGSTPLNAIGCETGCALAVSPIQTFGGTLTWGTLIPNDSNLIGSCLTIQSGCIRIPTRCVQLSGALRVCVTDAPR